ncbi:MAG: hypothetical protein HRT41_02585 [Campylobacteraceae bacterium]|nr:hypothetical protein [Campylobacteraceae bacterium]
MQKQEKLSPLKPNELKEFIEKNTYLIYEYINKEVLKNTAIINKAYFIKTIKDIFAKNSTLLINQNILPYSFFTLLGKNGKLDYTSLREDTINLSKINKESSSYYNYVKFSITEDLFIIELMQNKTGGMAIKEDIVKFKKEIFINKSGLDTFILKQKDKT